MREATALPAGGWANSSLIASGISNHRRIDFALPAQLNHTKDPVKHLEPV
jgi:hypothetical protein